MNIHLDTRRHMELFDPIEFGDTPVHVIGCGATGSWLALQLAKLGISNIHIYDFDEVEEHNIPNQIFGLQDVGQKKVLALQAIIKEQTGLEVLAYDKKVTRERMSGYVFIMVDSMKSRQEIFNNCIKMKPNVKLMVEPRMGLDEARIYNVNPMNLNHIKGWEGCWYPDSEAVVSACGTSQTVITTALLTASICARQLINHYNEIELDNEILVDTVYNQIFTTKW